MTEPVAWKILKKSNWRWEIVTDEPSNYIYQEAIPLYTSEQLHPRVKMTQAEFDEFDDLYRIHMTVFGALDEILGNPNYKNLKKRFMQFDITQAELANLLVDFVPDNPEETIEIVPDMKWFVRSKELNSENNYYYFVGKRPDDYWPTYGYKIAAKQFDTKEEAEKWTNPDTEAVQLPVEGY